MPMIPLDLIEDAPDPVRRHAAGAARDRELQNSIAALGVLQPVLLAASGNSGAYRVIAGRRRVAAARAVGLAQIPAHVDNNFPGAHELAASAAENLVRAALEPLDQWRAMKEMQDAGTSLANAALALGLSDHRAKQLDRLSRLHPDLIAAIETHGMPDADELGLIAMAPPDVQQKAWRQKAPHAHGEVNWYAVAHLCGSARIPHRLAIFNTAESGVTFDGDLFAEADDEDSIFTTDVAGFLAAQEDALKARIAAAPKGKKHAFAAWKKDNFVLPKGWTEVYGTEQKWPKGATLFECVVGAGYCIGTIQQRFAVPPAGAKEEPTDEPADEKPARRPKAAAAETDAEQPEREKITAAGRDMIARAKTAALAKRFRDDDLPHHPEALIAYLVLAFGAAHVFVRSPNHAADTIDLGYHAEDIVPRGGAASLLTETAPTAAAAILADILIARDSDHPGDDRVFEWIGQHVGADNNLPRFDTPEFLATVGTPVLREIAQEIGMKPAKTAAGLRAQIAGHAPDWRPPGAVFGAPGPFGEGRAE